ncbi:MAG: peptide/nickel transport system substrate-binding protein [Solirubrobacteraceae bacterium]
MTEVRSGGDELAAMWSKQLSRRRLLQAAGVGAGAIALGGLSACGGGSSGGNGGTGGGPLVGALGNTFPDLDTSRPGLTPANVAIGDFWSERLYRLDRPAPRTRLTPELATELPRQLAPTTYRFKLRQGVTFHDGSPFTADDVAYTIERIKDKKTGSYFGQFFATVAQARAVGEHEVELRLRTPTTLLAPTLNLIPV